MTPLCCISVTVAMMSRITLHLRSYRNRCDDIIMSTRGLINYQRNGYRAENSILIFARPGPTRSGQSNKRHIAFPKGRRGGTLTELSGDTSFMADTFSMATMNGEGVAAVSYLPHPQQSSETEALVVDTAAPQRPTNPDELSKSDTVGKEGPTGFGNAV
jgi:hypothetical protein